MLRQVTYKGVFEPAGNGAFSVYFPDLPGCTSYGDTLSEVQRNSQDALVLHLYGMEQDGDPVPAPSATPEVDPETAAGYLVYMVTVFILNYKEYSAIAEYSAADKIFYGRFWGISDLMDFQSESPQALEDEFHKAVDDYLAFCAETGKTPQRERYSLKMITVPELEADLDKYVEMAQIQDVLIVQNGKVVAKLTAADEQTV